MEISVVGLGFVGRATHNMLDNHEVSVYDPALGYNILPTHTEACFVCVPTPTIKGQRDHSILESVLNLLEQAKYEGLVIIKSTISPYFTDNFKKYALDIMVSPEFLNQFEPYYAQQKHLIGVKDIYQARIYREIFGLQGYGHADIRTTDIKTAVMAKNVHNCHGAMKVAFFNEVFDICEKEKISYREMLQCIFACNENVHPQYTRIAADGHRGFSGSCFPKDSVAFANEYDIKTLSAAVEANCKWRKEDMDKCLK